MRIASHEHVLLRHPVNHGDARANESFGAVGIPCGDMARPQRLHRKGRSHAREADDDEMDVVSRGHRPIEQRANPPGHVGGEEPGRPEFVNRERTEVDCPGVNVRTGVPHGRGGELRDDILRAARIQLREDGQHGRQPDRLAHRPNRLVSAAEEACYHSGECKYPDVAPPGVCLVRQEEDLPREGDSKLAHNALDAPALVLPAVVAMLAGRAANVNSAVVEHDAAELLLPKPVFEFVPDLLDIGRRVKQQPGLSPLFPFWRASTQVPIIVKIPRKQPVHQHGRERRPADDDVVVGQTTVSHQSRPHPILVHLHRRAENRHE